jgi:predicted metal-binding membrane protein
LTGGIVAVAVPSNAGRGELIERLLRRDRQVVAGGLLLVTSLAWWYLLAGAGMDMGAMDMSMPMPWSAGYAVVVFLMWWVMMAAMMLPSAAPMILLFAAINRKQRERGAPYVATGVFAAGYGLAWGAFSLIAVSVQWGLERALLLSETMVGTSIALGGALLVAAGIWQLTPLKNACLRHCRSPIHLLSHNWRKGRLGALRMGLEHGGFCLGCCWVLMVLLFYGGVMNLYWIVGLCLFVLIEKLAPAGVWVGRLAGAGLIAWGGVLLAGTL